MNEKELHEEQYGKKKIEMAHPRQFCGLRSFLGKYDWDRYLMTHKLIEPGQRILDIGCGEGKMLRTVSGEFKELYGVDIAPSRIREAKEKIREIYPSDTSKFSFIENAPNEPLDFSNDFFDAVVCIAVMEHIYDVFGLVKEMYRVLKPDGYVIVIVPNICYLKYRLEILLGRLPKTSAAYNWDQIGWDGGHIHYFTMKKFCWLFEQQGFKIERKTGSGFLAKFRNWWPSLLTGDLIIKARKV